MDDVVLASVELGEVRLEVVVGDLTAQRVDAVVNAANSGLLHGGGVAGAIVRRGGEVIQSESLALAPVPVGGVAVTGAGRLPCRYVIHAVGPRWGEGDEEAKLRSAVMGSVRRAAEMGLASMAIPAISTGIFGYPRDAGCQVIVSAATTVLARSSSLRLVRFVALDRDTGRSFESALTHTVKT